MQDDRKQIWGWALYDWANSAYATTVIAGFFPVFFKKYLSAGTDVNVTTAQLAFGNSLACLLVALLAPMLGAIADRGSAKKKFLIFFAYLGALMTAGLFLLGEGNWAWAIFLFVMGSIGFSGANVFYDALLPSVAGERRIDYVSGLGYAMGYLGGGVLFLLNVLMTEHPAFFGLAGKTEAVKYSFITVALWWGGFTVFTIRWVKEEPVGSSARLGLSLRVLREGFRQFAATFRKIRHLKTVFLFLCAYWLYIDGVDTIIRMAVDYGITLGFDDSDLIKALLITQFVGFPAALLFGTLGQRWSARKSIFLGLGVYMFVTLWSTQMTNKSEFYVMAIMIGLVQGGVQALSRSFYSRIIPKKQAGEFYGFYNMLGKFAAIIGPVMIGGVGLLVKWLLMPEHPTEEEVVAVSRLASRWGIASILVLFLAGGVLFYFVDGEKGREDARRLEEIATRRSDFS